VVVPPLRDRRRELVVLAEHLLEGACGRLGREPVPLSGDVIRTLHAHRWPGNVRELKNVMDYAAVAAEEADRIEVWHLPEQLVAAVTPGDAEVETETDTDAEPGGAARADHPPPAGRFRPIDEEVAELERARMVQALAACRGVRNQAAALIRMPLRTFVTKLKRFAIQPGDWEKLERR
jgi:DNA-binding NtrC family response regulator